MKSHRSNLVVAWLVTSMLSIATALGGYAWGRVVDCKPGQIDGQCGLGTFLGLLYGVGAGMAIFLTATVSFLIVAYRRRSTANAQDIGK